jgi:hypothetical protein
MTAHIYVCVQQAPRQKSRPHDLAAMQVAHCAHLDCTFCTTPDKPPSCWPAWRVTLAACTESCSAKICHPEPSPWPVQRQSFVSIWQRTGVCVEVQCSTRRSWSIMRRARLWSTKVCKPLQSCGPPGAVTTSLSVPVPCRVSPCRRNV